MKNEKTKYISLTKNSNKILLVFAYLLYFFKVNLMHKYNENSTFNFQTQHTVM